MPGFPLWAAIRLHSGHVRAVLIIGGGPAGTVAAIALARAGVRTTVVEQHRFPRDKVCGECLSATGLTVLRDLGLAAAMERALRPRPLTRTILHPTDGPALALSLPAAMWGISRRSLDRWLLTAAADAGAEVRQPARCESVEPAAGGVRARVRDLASGEVTAIDADLAIVADGKAALLPSRPAGTGDLGIKSHWDDVGGPGDAIELFGVDGHYGGIAPVETGQWSVSFSVPAERVRASGGNLDALFRSIVAQNGALRSRLRGARRAGAWLASPLPRFGVAAKWPANVIPVGNAAAAIEPIGGEGMGLAMRSAQLATEAVLAARRAGRPVDIDGLRRRYRAMWTARRLACRATARLLSSPPLAAAAVALADGSPALSRLALHLIGK